MREQPRFARLEISFGTEGVDSGGPAHPMGTFSHRRVRHGWRPGGEHGRVERG
jgi:hypothetical protein